MAEPSSPHAPSISDVFAVKDIFFSRFALPLEIIDGIIDLAEYWPCTSTVRAGGANNAGGQVSIRAGRPTTENQLILRSYPLGYIPTKDDPTQVAMSSTDTYPSIPPRPWLPPDESPTKFTSEVIAEMLKDAEVRGEHPCRKVVFTLRSHDQGWGGTRDQKNTYKGSWTWFEAGKERLTAFKDPAPPDENSKPQETAEDATTQGDIHQLPTFPYTSKSENKPTNAQDTVCTVHTVVPRVESRKTAHDPPQTDSWFSHPLMPSTNHIQRNVTANKETQTHTISWRFDDNVGQEDMKANELDVQGRGPASMNGEYVRDLKIGDVVTVWAKARFPMWVNTVEEVRIDVYWAV